MGIHFDPLVTDLAALEHAVSDEAARIEVNEELPECAAIEIPVMYGGVAGPDLEAVAELAGCPVAEVIARHAAITYRVYMLGFVPGFAYMGTVDPSIAAPRHRVPRERVPAGSVGIAGRQTGVYPVESPGGWQLIGRTQHRDVRRRADAAKPAVAGRSRPLRAADGVGGMTGTLHVLKPGLLTTVQDLGRTGYQAAGVPVAGPMDVFSHRLANQLVGNPPDAATLEVTLMGPELEVDVQTTIAVAGAQFDLSCDNRPVATGTSFGVTPGQRIRFGRRVQGARAYVAIAGGLQTPPVLGSRATHLVSHMGGWQGRALVGGDRLAIGEQEGLAVTRKGAGLTLPTGGRTRLRVMPGPQADWFQPEALRTLAAVSFRVSPRSNRMGYRLEGPPLPRAQAGELISEPVGFGAIQVPAAGEPILLMADRQTAGGYPKIAHVYLGRLAAGGSAGSRRVHRIRRVHAGRSRGRVDRARATTVASPGPEGAGVSDLVSAMTAVFGAERVRAGVVLAPFTTFKVGGPADILFESKASDEIADALKMANVRRVPVTVLGGGSNVLIGDRGIRGW